MSNLQALLNKQVNIPVVDASSAINALLASKNITMPNLGMPAIDKAVSTVSTAGYRSCVSNFLHII